MEKFLLTDALKNGYAVGAFNFGTMEVLKAIILGAESKNSPVICQISESAMNFVGDEYLKNLIKAARKTCHVPVSFHLDHGRSFEMAKRAIKAGCDSVMIDASMLPYEDNVAITKKVVDYAHSKGVFVEGELGSIAGIEDELKVEDKNSFYTSPKQAKDFVKRTGVDSLAIAIGTKHGAYKYSGDAKLRFDILEQIQKEIPNVPLVLHGASGVEKSDVDALYDLGVDIRGAKGIPEPFLQKACGMHICKVNGDTDLRISYLKGILGDIKNNNKNIDYRKYLASGMNEISKIVAHKIDVYGSANKAPKQS